MPCFEISAINADKPPLGLGDVKDRVKQFRNIGILPQFICWIQDGIFFLKD